MIIRGVELVGADPSPRELLVSGSTIASVRDRTLAVSVEGPTFVFHDAIAFPGLINSHDHLEFNLFPPLGHKRYADYVEWGQDIQRRDADRIASLERIPASDRMRWGSLKNLLCGITTVAHHGKATDDLGGLPIGRVPGTSIHSVRWSPRWRFQLNRPIARAPYIFHVGEGTSRAAEQEIDELTRWNLFRRPLIAVHAIAMRPDQAIRFRAAVWCPVSNEFLYGKTADVASFKQKTTILFGSDSTLSAGWNFWDHLRRARALGALDDRELFDCVTHEAAQTWHLPGVGRIEAGGVADFVVARKRAVDPWDAFFSINPEDILLVVKAGAVVLYDRSLEAVRPRGTFSRVRLEKGEKLVAEDVPCLLARIHEFGLEPNLPILEAVAWPRDDV